MSRCDKSAVRREIKDAASRFTVVEKARLSSAVWSRVERLPQFAAARTIGLYMSLDDEVSTTEFIARWNGSKRIALPCVTGDTMVFRALTREGSCVAGAFGIMEPCGNDIVEPSQIDMIIVPGVAFDRGGHRLGRGRGYYDRYLPLTRAFKAGVCFPWQLVDEVPCAAHDVVMDAVVTAAVDILQ